MGSKSRRPLPKPKRSQPKVIRIRLDTWKWEGVVIMGCSAEECEKLLLRRFRAIVQIDRQALGQVCFDPEEPWVIWVKNQKDMLSLTHEALHITLMVLRHLGIRSDPASDEAYTYTQESILRQVLTKL